MVSLVRLTLQRIASMKSMAAALVAQVEPTSVLSLFPKAARPVWSFSILVEVVAAQSQTKTTTNPTRKKVTIRRTEMKTTKVMTATTMTKKTNPKQPPPPSLKRRPPQQS